LKAGDNIINWFKKLFCKHEYNEIRRYYRIYNIDDYLSTHIEYDLCAYKVYKCTKCNKIISENVFSNRYYRFCDMGSRIDQLTSLKYKEYCDMMLE
jgi:3-deoxy-D-arabino-heptulosonate 7-phosphate (DAHP) synthase class II